MTPDEAPRDAAAVFHAWAEAGRGEGMERGHLTTAAPVLADLDVGAGDRFLDLGCGVGWAARAAADRGAHSVGVDAAPGMLRRAEAKGSGASFVRASFEFLPFKDGAFDACFSMEALYYAGDLDVALGELARVLRRGAAVDVLVDYYRENVASHDWPDLTGVPMHLLTEAGWRARFVARGFRDVEASRLKAVDEDAEPWKREQGTLRVRAVR